MCKENSTWKRSYHSTTEFRTGVVQNFHEFWTVSSLDKMGQQVQRRKKKQIGCCGQLLRTSVMVGRQAAAGLAQSDATNMSRRSWPVS
jgi:hypothetical protein